MLLERSLSNTGLNKLYYSCSCVTQAVSSTDTIFGRYRLKGMPEGVEIEIVLQLSSTLRGTEYSKFLVLCIYRLRVIQNMRIFTATPFTRIPT